MTSTVVFCFFGEGGDREGPGGFGTTAMGERCFGECNKDEGSEGLETSTREERFFGECDNDEGSARFGSSTKGERFLGLCELMPSDREEEMERWYLKTEW